MDAKPEEAARFKRCVGLLLDCMTADRAASKEVAQEEGKGEPPAAL